MTTLTNRPLAVRGLRLAYVCDICNKKRTVGNHTKCSKERQRMAREAGK